MDISKNDALIYVVIDRFFNQRLPRILSIREKVRNGEMLEEIDISFLKMVMQDNRKNQHLLKNDEQLQLFFSKIVGIYKEIINLSLKNEKV